MKIIIGYIFAFYATKMGSRDSGDHIVPVARLEGFRALKPYGQIGGF